MRLRRGEVAVRLFPDYAGTVLWYPHDVDYAGSGLDDDLVADLRDWEDSYYAGLDDDLRWRSGTLKRQFHARGAALAGRVADALGDEFTVECHNRTFRGRGPARTPAAAAAFSAIAADRRAEQERIARLVAEGAELGWVADCGVERRGSEDQIQ